MSAPKIGEKEIAREVQAVLRNGGGTNTERAHVAVGLIEARIRRAYEIDGQLWVVESLVPGNAKAL